MKDSVNLSTLPSPTNRYTLDQKLGSGVFGQVYRASDNQAGGKQVAIKIQKLKDDDEHHILEEYKILRNFTSHPNIIDFYGIFCDKNEEAKNIWFILELCECGSIIDTVRKLIATNRKMCEEHIAFILKETIKALIYLHENNVMHRNIRCSNILMSKDGEVKLSDFGLSCHLDETLGKRKTSVGSPSWMAPEVVISGNTSGYGNRSDVWAIGITTIELADGKAPFQDMHPTRALFQIVRNPPPGLLKPSMWSNEINDFIAECLEKNPEHRPYVMELTEHPFIASVPENDYHLTQELKKLALDLKATAPNEDKKIRERVLKNGLLTTEGLSEPESMQVEDLAGLEDLTEDRILEELQIKLARGPFTSFIGDILLILNPNSNDDIYNETYHKKYECKSRSDNEPHIFAVADSAYQDAMHHNEPQHIVFSGESKSGKSTNVFYTLKHLTYLGAMKNNTAERIEKAVFVIRSAISAATNINADSTRCIFQTQITYGSSGKLSGAIFWLYQLEKWRVSSTDMSHANFNLLYYFYDSLEAENKLDNYSLESHRKHRYLRIPEEPYKGTKGVRESPLENIEQYREFIENLKALDWELEEISILESVLSAVLILGNVRFKESKDGSAEIENQEEAIKVAKLLGLEESKFLWALINYCVIERGTALKRRHSSDEARDARDMLASSLYKRIIDWMINLINFKLSFGRAVFGDKYSISLLDMFGFECFHRNRLEQLIVNTTNEQIQFLYNQRIFAWEMQEEIEEEIPVVELNFYDNKTAVDQLMGRPLGLFYILDEASRTSGGQEFIMSTIKNTSKGPHIKLSGSHEFCVAHFTGKINYDAREMSEKNKDFLPPEMIETIRGSANPTIQQMFRNKLTKTGNLTVSTNQPKIGVIKSKFDKETENQKARKFNTMSRGHFSQVHCMRTASATYRATSLELLKQLSIGPGSGGTHFVRCVRADLSGNPRGFQTEVVRQQLRALAVLDTAKARQKGFSCRIPFSEFIRRYKFLAFDFDENVEVTRDNCRLLLIRLKMEGWVLGKTKVFLKYYNEEFLSRLYEVQVKKIVKVQCMMRAFLARRKAFKSKSKLQHIKELKKQQTLNINEDEAALLIQKAYRGYMVRKAYGPLIKTTGHIDEETAGFLKRFAMKWRSRSIFQVLLQYRAMRYQDLVHFSQQVHIYNQAMVEALSGASASVLLERVDPQARPEAFLGTAPPSVWKLPFRIDQLQYFDTSYMCDPSVKCNDTFASQYDSDQEPWDEPLKRRSFASHIQPQIEAQHDHLSKLNGIASSGTQSLINIPFCRDPTQPIPKLPSAEESPKKQPEPENEDEKGQPTVIYRPPNKSLNDSVSHRPPVYKKKAPQNRVAAKTNYQPPTPWTPPENDDQILEGSYTTNVRRSEFTRSTYIIPNNMENPIRELQALAKSTGDINVSEDDPPYNFQAMLKKTPRNRASMKRSREIEHSILEDKSPTPINILSDKEQAPLRPRSCQEIQRNDIEELIKADIIRNDSVEDLYTEPAKVEQLNNGYDIPKRSNKNKECNTFEEIEIVTKEITDTTEEIEIGSAKDIQIDNKLENEKVQLAPGIMVEGPVTDL